MLRILQVIEGLYAGGMESMLMNYYRNIDKDIKFDFLVYSPKAYFDDEVNALGGRIYRITPRRKNPIKNYLELYKFFKEHTEYQIVQIHQGVTYFAPLLIAHWVGVKHIIAHTHGMNPRWIKRQGPFFKLITRPIITRFATDFIACSQGAAYQIFGEHIASDNKYVLMKNAIDIDKFKFNKQTRSAVRLKLGINENFVIGHVGNFTYPKNHVFIIKVFEEVLLMNKKAILLLVGDGIDKIKIMSYVKKKHLDDKVYFLGNRSDVNELLQAMDVFFFPSIYEGLPVALVEAQASGLKCVVSDTITKEVQLTPNIKYMSLEEDIYNWAAEIITSSIEEREKQNKYIVKNGYCIKTEAQKISSYYKKLNRICW